MQFFFFFSFLIHAHCSLNNVWLLHTLKTCTIIFVWFLCVSKGDSLLIFGCLSVQVSQNSSAIFLDGTNIINVKLCMMVLVIKVYLFTPLFFYDIRYIWGQSSVIKIYWKLYVIVRLSWMFEWLLTVSTRIFICRCLWLSYSFKGDNWHVSSFGKKHTPKQTITSALSRTPLKQALSKFAWL